MNVDSELGHRLGSFTFARTLTFTVLGDDPHDPGTVRVELDDGVQAPYTILTIEAVKRFAPPPVLTWKDGWIGPGDPWARIIHGNTLGIVRQARARISRT